MKIVVPKELSTLEQRVALTPETTKKMVALGHEVMIEKGAGVGAYLSDEQFSAAGATLAKDQKTLYKEAEVIIRVSPPSVTEINLVAPGSIILGLLRPYEGANRLKAFVARKVTAMACTHTTNSFGRAWLRYFCALTQPCHWNHGIRRKSLPTTRDGMSRTSTVSEISSRGRKILRRNGRKFSVLPAR